MNDERFECACRALHDQLISLDHVQHLHPSIRIVRHDIREPMAAGLDELVLVQAGPFLSPSVSLGDHLHLVDQVVTDKLRLPLPLDHFEPWPILIGRGSPSNPKRPQSQSLNVKILGVALISSTMAPAPEQWTVPAGIR